MKNRLNKLYADNRKAAARKFEVVAKADSSEVDIFLYDHIVSSEEEAEWWGGVAPESFVKAVYAVDPAHTINLRVNSPGGSVFAARAMEQLALAENDDNERIASRIRGTNRPLLQADDPIARWTEVYEQRRPLYERLATTAFDTSVGPLQGVVDEIVAWVRATDQTQKEQP